MDEKNENEVIAKIRNRRIELEMSYQDLADKTGISKSTLQRYETGFIKNLSIDKIEILASALNVSPGYLMGWEEQIKQIVKDGGITTIAARFEGEEFTKEDKNDIENFIKYVLSKKKK